MTAAPRPYTLVAELTYRCPLRCAYCANPVDWRAHGATLGAADWAAVLAQAEALGVVQVHLTGGEPCVRRDLEPIVRAARACDLYTNLVTSGVPLDAGRLRRLRAAGLDAVQLSFQDVDARAAARIAGRAVLDRKRAVARWTRALGLPLTVNVVLHRGNVDRAADFVALAEAMGADRLELAHAQYLGWALVNRDALLPTAAQVARAREVAQAARARLAGRMDVFSVLPDYHADRPKACMDGWARRYLVVAPDGLVLPCHAAHTIPGLRFERVTERPLAEIWADGPALAAFRGEAWMPEPCRSCARRAVDFGGCRCQAFHLLGDAAATDPACPLAPGHAAILAARAAAGAATPALRLRT
ncbi:MAG TPA: pyrroloquinoline quinone biosynthesis protein PqqE [Candidatus Binatia bacterium]|nr:pyrroloquinoline quinone biosynthesis protein PqqE [Candidatus Binatia bacterium]